MYQIEEDFRPLIQHFDLESLEGQAAPVYGLWDNYSLACANRAWADFAKENNGDPVIAESWGLGRNVLDAVPSDLKDFYAQNYQSCLKSGDPWNHEYECSSAALYRRFHQIVYPVGDGNGLLVLQSLVVEVPHDREERPAKQPLQQEYENDHGIITQCSHCRRIKHSHQERRWDWVPQWVETIPPDTSHGLCEVCLDHYYPEE